MTTDTGKTQKVERERDNANGKPGYKKTKLGWIPEDWKLCPIKSFGEIITGNTPSTKRPEFYGGNLPFVSPADMNGLKYVTKTDKKLTQEGFDTGRKVVKGAVLFVSIGSTIGKTAVAGTEVITNQQINSVVTNDDNDGEFLFYQLSLNSERIKRIAGNQAVPIINKSTFAGIQVYKPPLPEQQKIATILSTWDKAIDQTRQLIEKKQQLKKGLAQQLLTGKKRLPGFSGEWKEVRLGEVVEICSSKRVLQKDWKLEGVPFFRTREIISLANGEEFGTPIYISEELFQELKVKYGVPKAGDILVTGVGTIGETYIVRSNDRFYFKDGNVLWIKMNDRIDSIFLHHLFKTRFIRKQLFNNASITTVATFTIKGAQSTKIKLPDREEQQQIAAIFSSCDKEIQLLNQKLTTLQEQKKGLMQVLLTGRVRVKVGNYD